MATLAWGAWGDEWALNEKVSFNGTTKRVTVNSGVTSINLRTDVYSAWCRWTVREDNLRFPQAMRSAGGDIIPGGETGITFFTINDWKLCYDPNVVAVTGVLYSEDYQTAFWSLDGTRPIYPATVSSLVNSSVSYQNVVSGVALTAEQTANAVWGATTRTLTALGLTPEQIAAAILAAAQITPIHADMRKNNGALVIGDGSVANPWRGEGVSV